MGNDALRFVKMVQSGEGEAAYRKSFLAQEHLKAGLGGVGGLAQLRDSQFNIPWLVNLNKALSTAKLKPTYKHVLAVQSLLDVASVKEHAMEGRWKDEQDRRARVREQQEKDSIVQEKKNKRIRKEQTIKNSKR